MASLPFAHIVSKFILEGISYDIEDFKINFSQPIDYKGQPQHEIRGGQLSIVLTQIADTNLYTWAKTSIMQKNGEVLFQTDLGITVLKIKFEKAYCTKLERTTNSGFGTTTSLIISPETISLNGIEHTNAWPK